MSRKLMSVVAAAAALAISHLASATPVSSFITASMDAGTAKTGDTWYEVGYNAVNPTTGLPTGLINAQNDAASTYLIAPSAGNNVLMLDTATKTGTITFATPTAAESLSFATSSGNGAGALTATVHFSDGTSDVTGLTFSATDWFNNNNRVATANGRVQVSDGSIQNLNSDNPRLYYAPVALTGITTPQLVSSIDLAWTGGATTHSAIFGVSAGLANNTTGPFVAVPLAPSSFNQDVIVDATAPEPASIGLLSVGALGLLARRRRA